jgi:hypothetical protein
VYRVGSVFRVRLPLHATEPSEPQSL